MLFVKYLKELRSKNDRHLFLKNNNKIKLYWSRYLKVNEFLIGLKLSIHNGRNFFDILIRKNMENFCLGSFSYTRKKVYHLKYARKSKSGSHKKNKAGNKKSLKFLKKK